MYCGTLKSAICSRAYATTACGSNSTPGAGTITAPTFSPIMSSGTPITDASPTPGAPASAASTSTEYTFSPPRLIMSFLRSTM